VLGTGYFKIFDHLELAGNVVSQRIHIQPQVFGEQLSEGL
jgi:hypothetical protein